MKILHDIFGPVLRTGLTWLGRRRLPQIEGSLTLSDLSAPVEVIRDRWGAPHIYADTADDLFLAQGFIHAQERLWQMELNRRTASGRLSELFGPIALDTDRAARTFGFRRLAQIDWANADEDLRRALRAYTHGVNAFLQNASCRLPVEFTLLGYRPESWQPEDSVTFLRLMTWQLSHAWYSEIVRAQLIEAVGETRAAEWEIHYPPGNPVTLPKGLEFHRLDPDGSLHTLQSPFLDRGQGSNAWAISGRKSPTGQPFLGNDVHLGLRAPSTWYQAHLITGNFNVTGVSLPGAPFVFIGHNARIAWGITLAFTDCEDLYVERFDPQDPHRYQFCGSWREAEIILETIRVKGRAEPHVEQIVITRHGPIISEVVGTAGQRLALNSMALQPSSALKAWWLLNQASDWNEFVEAMHLIEAPQLNVVYADVRGNIGYWLTGKVPVRAKGQGSVPVPGWTDEYEWLGEVPFEEMPHALNPKQGYVISSNQRVVSDDYPYFLGHVWMNGYRARRLVDIFESKDILTRDDFRATQLDFTCPPGQEFVESLVGLTDPDPAVQMALERLRAWDGQLGTDSVAGALYEVTRYTLVRNLLEPSIGRKLTKHLLGEEFNPVLLAGNEFYGYDTVSLLRMLNNPDSEWIKQAGGREVLLRGSLKQAISWLETKLGPDLNRWRWGKIHRTFFQHVLGAKKPLDRIFNRGPFPIGGDTDTLCQTAMLPNAPYDNRAWGPSMRQIVDMSDFSRSLIIVPPGQSGHIASAHYDDQIQLWLEGEYHPMLWTREQVEREAEGRLLLTPLEF